MKPPKFRCALALLVAPVLVLSSGALPAQSVPHNILFVLADDIGTDAFSIYNTNTIGTSFASTPNIDALAAQSVRFRNCYGYPSCTPTRSCLLTGRYGFRTGLGAAIDDPHDPYLSPRDYTLAKALTANPQLGIQQAHIGKWHLSEAAIDPNFIGGWSHYSGYLGGERESYFNWEKTIDGVTSVTTNYCLSDSVDDAINWIGAQGTNRWFLWFAPKAAHAPLHKPPNDLHSYDSLPGDEADIATNQPPYYRAMIEALDTEMGRLLPNINFSNTLVVFMADNGTPVDTIQPPYAFFQCKGTLFEGGVRLPMFITGAGVVATNRWTDAVVHAVDIPVTLLEMAGVNLAGTMPTNLTFDGRSFANVLRNQPWNPTEDVILMENFGSIIEQPFRGVAVRGARYKLHHLDSGVELFYDLQSDPYEHTNLISSLTVQQQAVYSVFTNKLAGWHNPPTPPTVIESVAAAGTVKLSVPEQLGINYGLLRTTNPVAGWTLLTNYVREVHTNQAVVSVTDPTPVSPAFYRVVAQGR